MSSHRVALVRAGFLLVWALTTLNVRADEPKPTPENTIHVQLGAPVPPQKFAKPPKFYISEVIDRSGNPQPLLVLRERGGVFLDRQPTQITREAIIANCKFRLSAAEPKKLQQYTKNRQREDKPSEIGV